MNSIFCNSDAIFIQFRCQSLDGVQVGGIADSLTGSILFQGWVGNGYVDIGCFQFWLNNYVTISV